MTLVPKDDMMGQMIFNGADPAITLAKVRDLDGFVSYVQVAVSSRPIDYLHKRGTVKQRIADAQFFAAERYLNDYSSAARVGSNTASTMEVLSKYKRAWSSSEAEEVRSGNMVRTAKAGDAGKPSSVGDAVFAMAIKMRNVNAALSDLDRLLITNLVLKEYPIGVMSSMMGIAPEALGVLVRAALWSLAATYRRLDPEFRQWCENQMRMQDHGDGAEIIDPIPEQKRSGKKSNDKGDTK